MSANTFHSAGVGFEKWIKVRSSSAYSGNCDATPELVRASPEPRPARAAPDFNAYCSRDRSRRGTDKDTFRPVGFISGGCLKVREIYFPKLLSGGRDAGLFVPGQC
jgi:hypothetical protein